MSPLEVWHRIYDAAMEAGQPSSVAAAWADARYWPFGVPIKDEEVRRYCSPFREPTL